MALSELRPSTENSVTVLRTTVEQVYEIIEAGFKRVKFRLDWEDYDRYGWIAKGWIFVDYLSHEEYCEHNCRALVYNRRCLTVRENLSY